MPNNERRRKSNHSVGIDLQFVEPANFFSFGYPLIARVDQAELRFSHAGVPKIRDAIHDTEPAVERSDDQAIAKDDASGGPGEADKDQAGNNGEPDHPEKYLDRDNYVPVDRCRIIMPVADRSKSLDTEEKGVRE